VTIFLVISMFFFGCGAGALVQRLVDKRQNIKEGTPSASHNTDMVHGAKAQICPYWQRPLCGVCCDHKMCKTCPHYTGKVHHV